MSASNSHDPDPVTPAVSCLPAALAGRVDAAWGRFVQERPDCARRIADREDVAASLPRVWAASEFVVGSLMRNPDDVEFLLGDFGLAMSWTEGPMAARLAAAMAGLEDESDAMRTLRVFRRHEMLKAAWRDLAGWADLPETLGHVSELADAVIREAVKFSGELLARTHGRPVNEAGAPVDLLVLAMGKLGGRELNFSSDVDLVFLFECGGETSGRRPISHDQFFIRQGQRVIRLLEESTQDGIVFRVDMRLRPFGDSGPLAVSLAALEDYLQQHGRPWERYAYVKARPLTGYRPGIGLYRDLLRPFVYRKYLDFTVFESLREMKRLIDVESADDLLQDDIKRGPGGIREVEFIAQSQQILRGGANQDLRTTSLLDVLPKLSGSRLLSEKAVHELESSYVFFRRVENRLQQWQDRQVHRLPETEVERERLAFSLDFRSWDDFAKVLSDHRRRVQCHFDSQLEGAGDQEGKPSAERAALLWAGSLQPAAARQAIGELGFGDTERAVAVLARMRDAGFVARLEEKGRQRLDALVPNVLRECGGHREPELVLERVAAILEAVGLRSAYFALLNENPGALTRLVELSGHSEFLAGQISRHPLLMDELIDPRVLDRIPDRASLYQDLRDRLRETDSEDEEGQLETLRQFQRSAVFLVAVADLSGTLPLMKVSDRLTDIAEVVLQVCIDLAWTKMVSRHGAPCCRVGGRRREAGFAAIGYGKLGGLELGYGSDLDLVFVNDSEGQAQVTDGMPALENGLFFGRLTRRLVHLMSTQTSSGRLYEVDTRLRPSGKGGLLVTSLDAFARYQREQAWTWEHQALLRARAVAGSPHVIERFEALRRELLCSAVHRDSLRQDVIEMRERMRAELSGRKPGVFDVKQDRGGIADIEFLVQFRVLQHAHEHPTLVTYSDNIRQLDSLIEAGIMDEATATELKDTYLAYRARVHRLALEDRPGEVSSDEFVEQRRRVAEIWSATFG
jgi:glutamate-ammonia-ligase adenylyltransferase